MSFDAYLPERHWLRLKCRTCGAPFTGPLLHQGFLGGLRYLDAEEALPPGSYLGPEDAKTLHTNFLGATGPDWEINLGDFAGARTSKYCGCCGPDGSLMNLLCPGGHPVGREYADCWLFRIGLLSAAETEPEFTPFRVLSFEGDPSETSADGLQGAVWASAWETPSFVALRRDEGPWSTLSWCEADATSGTLRPRRTSTWLRGGRCVPVEVLAVPPPGHSEDGEIDARLPDGSPLRLKDPLWPLYPHVWQVHADRPEWFSPPAYAWVRLAGVLEGVQVVPSGEAVLRPAGGPGQMGFTARLEDWGSEGCYLGRSWRQGCLSFPGAFLDRLPVWMFTEVADLINTEPGQWLQGSLRLQGTFVCPWDGRGESDFRRGRGSVVRVPWSRALLTPGLRKRAVRALVLDSAKGWRTRWGKAGSRLLMRRVSWVLRRVLAHESRGRALDGVFEFVDEALPPEMRDGSGPGKDLANVLIRTGLLDPDALPASMGHQFSHLR